jgi:hypothetical protein
MVTEKETDAKRGQAIYTKSFLSLYDLSVLGFFCRFVWKCPSHHILELYDQYASANHLDIGLVQAISWIIANFLLLIRGLH